MRKIKLTRGYIALVDDEDYKRISAFKWTALVGLRRVRPIRSKNRKHIYMHHEILQVRPADIWPKEVDHIDRNPLNNQKSNLRIVYHYENLKNTRKVDEATGVDFNKANKKWRARAGRHNHIGFFSTREEALEAVKRAKE